MSWQFLARGWRAATIFVAWYMGKSTVYPERVFKIGLAFAFVSIVVGISNEFFVNGLVRNIVHYVVGGDDVRIGYWHGWELVALFFTFLSTLANIWLGLLGHRAWVVGGLDAERTVRGLDAERAVNSFFLVLSLFAVAVVLLGLAIYVVWISRAGMSNPKTH